ncbi:MAG TPA: FGGY family carbohydrate kinase [Candidatus Baltobacteraceae bacterium]|nr:FGGY family carbohydrate kinase [Candidatus Baltobacteraceae bacterium]
MTKPPGGQKCLYYTSVWYRMQPISSAMPLHPTPDGVGVRGKERKVCLWDAMGTLLASADEGYPTRHPQPDWADQDPADWWRTAVNAARNVVADQDTARIAAIGLSSQHEVVGEDFSESWKGFSVGLDVC